VSRNQYYYGWYWLISTFLPTMVLTGVSIFSITVVMISVVKWIISNSPAYITRADIIGGSIGITLVAVVTGFMAAVFANVKPNVRVHDNGLEVQIFLFWWRLIPWEDVKDIRSVPIIGRSRLRLVIVHKLTFIHRIVGTTYFAFFQPAFLISSKINNYDELIHLIKKKIGRELWE